MIFDVEVLSSTRNMQKFNQNLLVYMIYGLPDPKSVARDSGPPDSTPPDSTHPDERMVSVYS